jgi:hypothetical protein
MSRVSLKSERGWDEYAATKPRDSHANGPAAPALTEAHLAELAQSATAYTPAERAVRLRALDRIIATADPLSARYREALIAAAVLRPLVQAEFTRTNGTGRGY